MMTSRMLATILGGAVLAGGAAGVPTAAKADTASTVAIAAGAAAIVGALIYDSNNHPYYVRDNRRYYVSPQVAQYYRSHHGGYERRAYVPEREYPVQRDWHDDNGRWHH